MRNASTKAGGALVLGLLVAGCGGADDPGPAEVFELREVGGEPLPISYPEEAGCTEELRSATLTLEEDGDWEMVQTKVETCGERVEEDEDTAEGTFQVAEGSYAFAGSGPTTASGSVGELEVEALADATLRDGVLEGTLEDGTVVVFRRR